MIPIYTPYLKGNIKEYVNDALESSWISSRGKYLDLFNEELKKVSNRKFVSLCSSGTTALDLALKAINIKPGDEIITAAFTYVASTNAILIQGAIPVFVDINSSDWNINCSLIEQSITSKTKAILVANVYGYPVNYHKIKVIAQKYNLKIIEDAAESLGAEAFNIKSGSFGDISTFSFFGNKTITTGEGGAVLTDNQELFNRVEILKNQGNSLGRKYFHDTLGYNYRMTNIQAAIGLSQIELIEKILHRKRQIAAYYKEKLSQHVIFQRTDLQIQSSNWIVTILLNSITECIKVNEALESNNIETRPLFYPVDGFEFYEKSDELPVTYSIYDRGICLPSYPGLERGIQDKIIEVILRAISEIR